MAYERPITIKEAIVSIQEQEYVLPSIQREFVWQPDQILMLFDSLMRSYPISTFLFWKIKAQNISKFPMYKFLKDYHQRDNKRNQKADLSGTKDVIAILDGQQRLTSLYIGLRGSDARKLPYYQWSSDNAFPKKKAYLNLLDKAAEESEQEYDFRFLTDNEKNKLEQENTNHFWFPISEVINFSDLASVMMYLTKNGLMDTSKHSQDEVQFALNTLSSFFKTICENNTVNFYLEKSEELDKVLQIFIRINSGGTKLSYSDLLLSIATAQWNTLDAREEIHKFVDKINKIGNRFSFNKDFVLKSCLVLADINNIKFRVDNFTSENMEIIEAQWEDISNSISTAVKLIAHFGFDGTTLRATNAVIPIAYFLKKKGIGEEILHQASHATNRENIKQWLIRALLRKTFGGQPDSLYPIYRRLINDAKNDTFPLNEIIERFKGHSKSLVFTTDHIDHLLTLSYGNTFTFMVLSLLYPLNNDYTFDQDHIHPKSFFNKNKLKKVDIVTDEAMSEYLSRYNLLPNLQLLQSTANKEKSAKPLSQWIVTQFPQDAQLNTYKQLNYIPLNTSLEFDNFVDFYEERKELLKVKLMQILNVQVEGKIDAA
jgi:uncharacterized protein with ParB-like and HNH nuclease domain